MNDFTKEELHRLYSLTIVFDGEAVIPLRHKIQSMIDNYCEHDYRSMGNHNWLHCIKCRKNYNFTKTEI